MSLLTKKAFSYTSCSTCPDDEDAEYQCKNGCIALCEPCNDNEPNLCENNHTTNEECGYSGYCYRCIPRTTRFCTKCGMSCPRQLCSWGSGTRREVKKGLLVEITEDCICLQLSCRHCDPVYTCMRCQRDFCRYHKVKVDSNHVLCTFCVYELYPKANSKSIEAGCKNTNCK